MSIFKRAITDIFKTEDFLEECVIGGRVYKCICSAIADNIVYGDIGAMDDVSFTLDIALPVDKMPGSGEKVTFRNKKYKVSNVTYDSANASISIHLQSTSKG